MKKAFVLVLLSAACFALPPVTVTPATVWMKSTQTQQFYASQIPGCAKMNWSADKGTITAAGLYTAVDAGTATIKATPTYCARRAGSVQVHITAAPTSYPVARTDQNTQQLPSPMPVWGPAGSTWVNPTFPGTVYTRLSDATLTGASIQTADSGEPRLYSADSSHVIVHNTFAHSYVIGADGSKTGLDSNYAGFQFTARQPLQMTGISGTQLRLLTAKPDWSGFASNVLLFDYASANCLGLGYIPTWHGTVTVSDDDTMYKTDFSDTGGQGTGDKAVAYSAPRGCFVYNSVLGTMIGPTGFIGYADDGVNPLVARFYQHEGGGSPTSTYSLVSASEWTKGHVPGCVSGPGTCLIDMPYAWEIGTTHVYPCGIKCDGHGAKGTLMYTGKEYTSHDYANLNAPLIPMVHFPAGFPDHHGTAGNQTTGLEPIFLVSTKVGSSGPYPMWGWNEVIGIPSDGSGIALRIGQTLNTDTSPYFICQNAVGVVAPDGHHLVFTSDMGKTLGFEADGVTPQCHAFQLTF